jgi:hypothetical protein
MKSTKVANHERYRIFDTGTIISSHNNNTLNPRVNPNGYLVVTLDGEQLAVHRLVAKHFIPNPYDYPQVNHKNGNKHDNNYLNLEWVTSERNINHALETGLRKGFVSYDTKLSLMHRALNGELIANLALELPNTHPNTLSRMLRVTAEKENLLSDWKDAMKKRRAEVAVKNLPNNK